MLIDRLVRAIGNGSAPLDEDELARSLQPKQNNRAQARAKPAPASGRRDGAEGGVAPNPEEEVLEDDFFLLNMSQLRKLLLNRRRALDGDIVLLPTHAARVCSASFHQME